MSKIVISKLVNENCPHYLNETIEHIEICHEIVELSFRDRISDENKKLAVNIYRRQAKDIELATQMKFLLKTEIIKFDDRLIIDVPVSESVKYYLSKLFINLTFDNKITSDNYRLNSTTFKLKSIVKGIVNKLFLLCGIMKKRKKKRGTEHSVIRSWVDVTLDLFPQQIANSYILVYPFGINIVRQFKYLSTLRKKEYDFQLTGIDYSVAKLIYWSLFKGDSYFFEVEQNAYLKHAHFLKEIANDSLHTTDEFEPGSFIVNEYLISNGVVVTNKAHGIGKYSPFVRYSKFVTFNKSQKDYYSRFSNGIIYESYERNAINFDSYQSKVLVFIDQLPEPDSSLLHKSQLAAVEKLRMVAKKFEMEFKVKLHPNVRKVAEEYEDVKYTGNPQAIEGGLFFTFFSTAYLSFESFAPTFLLKDDIYDPKLIFGDDERVIELEDIEEHLIKYVKSN